MINFKSCNDHHLQVNILESVFDMRSANNTLFNKYFLTHSLLLVKIHIGPSKSCESHMNFVVPCGF